MQRSCPHLNDNSKLVNGHYSVPNTKGFFFFADCVLNMYSQAFNLLGASNFRKLKNKQRQIVEESSVP